MSRPSRSFTHEARRRILYSLLAVFVLIWLVGTYSFLQQVRSLAHAELTLVMDHLRSMHVASQWGRVQDHPDRWPDFLAQLRFPGIHMALVRDGQVVAHNGEVPRAESGLLTPWAALLAGETPRYAASSTLPLDAHTRLHVTVEASFYLDYWQFMRRPLMAITLAGLVIMLVIGRWLERKRRLIETLIERLRGFDLRQMPGRCCRQAAEPECGDDGCDEFCQALEAFNRLCRHMAAHREALIKYRHLLDALGEPVVEMTSDGEVIDGNEVLQGLLQARRTRNFIDLIHPQDRKAFTDALTEAEQGRFALRLRLLTRPDDYEGRWHEGRFLVEVGENGTRLTGILRDVHEMHLQQQRIEHMALHDALTGLPNRVLLEDRIDMALARMSREGGGLALLFFDLDGFKRVNDTLGHAMGDRLLETIARRVRTVLRESDTLARWGGDEFVVLLAADAPCEAARTVAEKILQAVRQPVQLGAETVTVSTSIGVACAPQDGRDVETLLRRADEALYAAKETGRDRVLFWRALERDDA
ncbi:diguanylate cyclase [Sulfurivirga sp.]|uniref:diguanylate cyclase domain-containing protein n=1 Tax=Sulfurivirga sp. TaxID=2614236 RepID=UPI0025E803CF|nr:diguanylate cyclase [Sulfurivirga sp.]